MNNANVIYYRHNRHGFARDLAPRSIHYHELTLVLEGQLDYRVNGTPVMLRARDAVLIRSGEKRERAASDGRVDYVSFNFYCDALPSELPTQLPECIGREIRLLLAACDEMAEHTQADMNRRRGFVLDCLLQLLCEAVTVTYSPLCEQILHYLHAHIKERVTLAEIGREMHFSPVYCDTLFKRETGQSIIAYLIDARMNVAKKMLEEGRRLRDVASAVGFEDYNYFSRCFKRKVGYTPKQYRDFLSE